MNVFIKKLWIYKKFNVFIKNLKYTIENDYNKLYEFILENNNNIIEVLFIYWFIL